MFADSSNTTARELVVPWSSATMYFMMRTSVGNWWGMDELGVRS